MSEGGVKRSANNFREEWSEAGEVERSELTRRVEVGSVKR